jgi:ADP-heptose:LPS heptosyltransferase
VRVLALRALGLGDLLTAVPALRALRDAFPDASLELACPTWLHGLVDAAGLADVAVDAGPLRRLATALHGADLAVNLHGRGPESTSLLVATHPGALVAFRQPGLPETRGMPHWRPGEHERVRWCRLLSESGIPADAARFALRLPHELSASSRAGCTILHSGAASRARRWPEGRWARLARDERASGRRVVLTGTPDERAACVRIAAAARVPQDDVLAGRTSLTALAALVASAGLVVSGDTGVAHLATAFGTPAVVLFGPVSPAEWGPPTGGAQRALWTGLHGDPHGDEPDPGLLEVTPERVLGEIEALRASRPAYAGTSLATTRAS